MKRLSSFIKTAAGFQYSVNLRYDLAKDNKVSGYIPLVQSSEIIKDVISANRLGETIRARILIGAYGTGKSHLVLVLLSVLSKLLPPESFESLTRKMKQTLPEVAALIETCVAPHSSKMLPVLVESSGKSLEQALLLGLRNSLEEYDLGELMPSTTYQAAQEQINEWREQYPQAYHMLSEYLIESKQGDAETLEAGLRKLDDKAYALFCDAYREVTHGAVFEPLLRGRPEDVYRELAKSLPQEYKGIVVVFDEFGKYLETAWGQSQDIDLKPLQDFAEACNASEDIPIQLLLVSHKPIAQYAMKFGSEKVNEWKKVEGRFKTLEMLPQVSKAYEVIAHVIMQEGAEWEFYQSSWENQFEELIEQVQKTRLFSELQIGDLEQYVVKGAFPLHPLTVFALPRLAQKVAQNERTIFTFLTENDFHALPSFLRRTDVESFKLLTLDELYDYFSASMQALEEYDEIRAGWMRVQGALSRLADSEFIEARLLKAIGIINAISQPGVLPATEKTLQFAFYGSGIDSTELGRALQTLRNKRILLKGFSSGQLEILQPGELDIPLEIERTLEKRRNLFSFIETMNERYVHAPILAKEYNDLYAMTRYFSCQFVWALDAIQKGKEILTNDVGRDGIVLFALPDTTESEGLIGRIREAELERAIFLVPNENAHVEILALEGLLRRDDAISCLLEELGEEKTGEADRIQLLLLQKDIRKTIQDLLNRFFGYGKVTAYWKTETSKVLGKASLSRLVSTICLSAFDKTPRMNNEMINKHRITTPIAKARQKIVDGLLRPYLEPQLGLTGSGPEVSIYRCLLRFPEIVKAESETDVFLTPVGELQDQGLQAVLMEIQEQLRVSAEKGMKISEVIARLCAPPYGLRKGIIPIVLALFLHNRRQEVQLLDRMGNERMLSGENIELAMKDPDHYLFLEEDWTEEKRQFSEQARMLFQEYIDDNAELMSASRQLLDGMRRWFVSLPRLTRDTAHLSKEAKSLRKVVRNVMLSSSKALFIELPRGFGGEALTIDTVEKFIDKLRLAKEEIEAYQITLLSEVEHSFLGILQKYEPTATTVLGGMKLWFSNLNEQQKSYLYSDGTQEIVHIVESFSSEDSNGFLKKLLLSMTGVRMEDWSDNTRQGIEAEFHLVLQEIEARKDVEEDKGVVGDIMLSYVTEDGNKVDKRFEKVEMSPSGILLQNVVKSYIRDFGDSITNHEKRYILAKVLEELF